MLKAGSILLTLAILTGCSQANDEADLQLFGPTSELLPLMLEIDKDLTADCGEAGSSSSSSGTSESSTSSSSGSTSKYDIESYYQFQYGEFLLMRYTYDENRNKFTLSPTTSTIQTCQTSDGINCDNVGTQTCETADNIKCGGSKTVIYSVPYRNVNFQAISGTIDYSDGFSIDTTSGIVDRARLELNVVDRAGNVLSGSISCTSSTF